MDNRRSKAKSPEMASSLKKDRVDSRTAKASESFTIGLFLGGLPLLYSIPETVWLKDRRARFVTGNDVFASTMGLVPGNPIGGTEYAVRQRAVASRGVREDRATLKPGCVRCTEKPFPDPNGGSSGSRR
jgi:hypothetical protein